MICITKPLLPRGYIDTDQTIDIDPGEYIDGTILSRNFQSVFRTLNGSIHANNFINGNYHDLSQKWKDKYIQFPEFVQDTTPVVGYGHSHNGVDSAPLGPRAIDMRTTVRRGFGAWMLPSHRYTCLLMHGSAGCYSIGGYWQASTGTTYQTLLIDLPFDNNLYSPGVVTSTRYDKCRVFVQIRCTDPAIQPLISSYGASVLKFTDNSSHAYAPYIRAYVRYSKQIIPSGVMGASRAGISTTGLWVDWITTMMVYRT
jgi:hypothetical protein